MDILLKQTHMHTDADTDGDCGVEPFTLACPHARTRTHAQSRTNTYTHTHTYRRTHVRPTMHEKHMQVSWDAHTHTRKQRQRKTAPSGTWS